MILWLLIVRNIYFYMYILCTGAICFMYPVLLFNQKYSVKFVFETQFTIHINVNVIVADDND